MDKRKIYITSCDVIKSGETNGRKWVMYRISDAQGTIYTSFEGKYGAMLNQEVEVLVQEKIVEKNGKTYKNLTIIEPKRQEIKQDDILAMINDLRERVEALENGTSIKIGTAIKAMKEEIKPDELNF